MATRRPIARIILASGLVLALALAALAILVPRWVKSKIIAAAAAHGVSVTIGDLGLGIGHAKLKNVTASALIRSDAQGAPKASASAALVDVTLDWLTPTAVDVTALKISLDAGARDLRAALASRNASGGSAASITRVTLHDASLEWKHAVPLEKIVLSADHIDGDVTKNGARALGEDFHFEAKELHATEKKDLAAWNAKIDGDDKGSRVELTLGKNAQIKIADDVLDIDTPSVTLKDVGLPGEALGLYGDETSRFEIHLHHQSHDTQAQGTFVGTASDVFLGASTARTSLAIDLRYAGDPSKSLKIIAGTLRAGPFTGAIEGGFAIDPALGLKASLRYSSGLMACVDAVKAQAASYGAVGQGVAALAGMLGLDKAVEGRISLKGEIEIDSATHTNRFSFRTLGDCKLSYLPSAL